VPAAKGGVVIDALDAPSRRHGDVVHAQQAFNVVGKRPVAARPNLLPAYRPPDVAWFQSPPKTVPRPDPRNASETRGQLDGDDDAVVLAGSSNP
jgi:hypothetical protein